MTGNRNSGGKSGFGDSKKDLQPATICYEEKVRNITEIKDEH
jgi:hypothetical protein